MTTGTINDFEIRYDGTIMRYCGNHSSVIIPSEIDGIKMIRIHAEAFKGSDIEEIILPVTLETLGDYAFSNCNKLRRVKFLGNSLDEIPKGAFEHCSNLECVEMPRTFSEQWEKLCAAIDTEAFAMCTNLKSIKLPSNTRVIGEGAFRGCYSLEGIEIPESCMGLGTDAFWECSSLRNVTIKTGSFEKCSRLVDHIRSRKLFANCRDLTSVEIRVNVEND